MLPKEFPPYQTVYEYFRNWRLSGVWERLHDTTWKVTGKNG
jgi:transposase